MDNFIQNYLALTIFSCLLFGGLYVVWAWRQGERGARQLSLLIFGGITLLAGFVVSASTGLVGTPWINLSLTPLLKAAGPAFLAVVTVLALAVFLILSTKADKKKTASKFVRPIGLWLAAVCALSVVGLLALQIFFPAPVDEQTAEPAEQELDTENNEAQISLLEAASETLPAGFTLQEVLPEATLERPINFTIGPEGEIYIASYAGGISRLAPPPWDTQEPLITPFAPDVPQITGMVYFEGALYANGSGSLFKLTDTDADGLVDTTETLIEGMPSRIYDHHSNNSLVIGNDGRFYFGLGGTTDHGPEAHELAGSILAFDLSTQDLTVFARGLRNPYDMVFCPSQGGPLFSTDNGPDSFDETLRFLPPDELNLVKEGKNYGYPTDFGYPPPWSDTVAPIALMETSGVPAGIACYEAGGAAGSFPAEYEQNLFVVLAGGGIPTTGHKIVRVQIVEENGQTRGLVSDFAIGLGRPVDILEYTDGSLLVLDYDLGQIYQILFSGN